MILTDREALQIGKQRSAPEEIVSLTSLRGILAIWVVLYHFWDDVLTLFPEFNLISPIMRVGNMAVPAFFMLSGFVLAYNYSDRFRILSGRKIVHFLCLRLARIYPVHIFALFILATMVWVSNRLGYKLPEIGYGTRDFILNLLLMQSWVPSFHLNWNQPSWSISSEWFAYLLFPFASALATRWLTTLARSLVIGLGTLIISILVTLRWNPLPFFELVLVIPTFVTGMSIYWLFRNYNPAAFSNYLRFIPELTIMAIATSCYISVPEIVIILLFIYFFVAILAQAWIGNSCHMIWKRRPAIFLGNVSYSLYMTHTLAQRILCKLIPSIRFEQSGFLTRASVLMLYLILVASFCLLMYYLVENPFRQKLKDLMSNNKLESSKSIISHSQ